MDHFTNNFSFIIQISLTLSLWFHPKIHLITIKICTCHDSCCHGMCKILWWSDNQKSNSNKITLLSNLNFAWNIISAMVPLASAELYGYALCENMIFLSHLSFHFPWPSLCWHFYWIRQNWHVFGFDKKFASSRNVIDISALVEIISLLLLGICDLHVRSL